MGAFCSHRAAAPPSPPADDSSDDKDDDEDSFNDVQMVQNLEHGPESPVDDVENPMYAGPEPQQEPQQDLSRSAISDRRNRMRAALADDACPPHIAERYAQINALTSRNTGKQSLISEFLDEFSRS